MFKMLSIRSSGILLHPTSLPGIFGSGDFGSNAFKFVDWLVSAGQTKWQTLPLGEVGPGTRFGAFLEAHGERLITGTIKLSRRISPKELPPPFGLPRYNMVYVPSGSAGAKPLVHQIIKWLNPEDPPARFGDVWAAEAATLTFSESELEEYTAIKPLEIIGAYYVEMGATIIKGTSIIHEW